MTHSYEEIRPEQCVLYEDMPSPNLLIMAFESSMQDYLYVIDENKIYRGIIFLNTFCEKDADWLEYIPPVEKGNDSQSFQSSCAFGNIPVTENGRLTGEYIFSSTKKQHADLNVLELIHSKSEQELETIFKEIFDNENFWIYGNSKLIELLKSTIKKFPYIKATSKLSKIENGTNLLVLSYKGIKLIRRSGEKFFNHFKILKDVLAEYSNKKIFSDLYPELHKFIEEKCIGFLYAILPQGNELKNLSQQAIKRLHGCGRLTSELVCDVVGEKSSCDYQAMVSQNKNYNIIFNGLYKQLEDCSSPGYNVIGGRRITTDVITTSQFQQNQPKIYSFGSCTARGSLVADKNTIQSYLQRFLNADGINCTVINCSTGSGTDLENIFRYIISLPIRTGDIILIIEHGNFLKATMMKNEIPFLDLKDIFNSEPIEGEWFLDVPGHCNRIANKKIAEGIFPAVKSFLSTERNTKLTKWLTNLTINKKVFADNENLQKYLEQLKVNSFKLKKSDKVGAILMYANPMTLGHKYLIKEALKRVEYLYIFVISEKKSGLPAELRYDIVCREFRNFTNIKVFPTKNVFANADTFPEYFHKDKSPLVHVDAYKDVLIFCQHIAPALNIKIRFIGTEPLDIITKQYNIQLQEILPYYKIKIQEIPRLCTSYGKVISSHDVRAAIKQKDWDTVAQLVSTETFCTLKQFYFGKEDDLCVNT